MCEHMCMYMQNLADGLMGSRGRVPLSTHWKKGAPHKPAPPEAGLSHKTTNWPGFKMRF